MSDKEQDNIENDVEDTSAIDAIFDKYETPKDEPLVAENDTETVETTNDAVEEQPKAPVAETTAVVEPEPIKAPETWAGEKEAAIWGALPKEAQEYIAQREKAVTETLKEKEAFVNEYGFIKDIVEPQRQNLAIHGQTPQAALQTLVAVNEFAQQKPMEYLQWYCGKMGINLENIALQFLQYQEQLTPEQRALQEANARIAMLEQNNHQTQQQQVNNEVAGIIAAFERDPANKYFARTDVRQKVGKLMAGGFHTDMKAAYEEAIWTFADIREELTRERLGTQAANSNAAVDKSNKMATRKLPNQTLQVPEGKTLEEQQDEIFRKHGL